ncbi:uncharacterized protein LOC101783572 isoform X1 [Setaria italica]|uniref:uncharacterized protein LOC101783572 isoform X1 n=1 Tax=Setaria italica TaxID=4555 RepID=UPI000BE5C083|nr:uncharacterized protein LOC101783572 isoform X1 [Setaria italica]
MLLPPVEEVSGSRRTRSSARRRRRRQRQQQQRSECQEPGPTPSVRRRGVQERKRNRAGGSCDDEKACRLKIRTCEDAALPPDAATARAQEEEAKEELEAASSALCEPRIYQEVVYKEVIGYDSSAVEVYSETFRKEEDQANEEEDAVSSAPSSPLCEPRILQDGHDSNGVGICKPIDLETFRAYRQAKAKFEEKLARKMKLPTLDDSISSCPVDVELRHAQQSVAKAARNLAFALSSSIGGKPLTQCSGFFIGWDESDESHETGIILTSAHLICSQQLSLDSWLCKDEYAPDAEVTVHFPDRTTAKGKLCYYQKHYNIALFRTKVKPSLQLPFFNDNVNCGQEVFMLGRDENSILKINHGQVQFQNPCTFERHHFMYTYGAALECCIGGPIVDFNGGIVGMSTPDTEGSFIPTSIILRCFHLWRKHERIPRPHLQLKLCAIQYLDPAQSERILLECGIDDGLIVQELEIMLLHLSQQHLDRRNNNDDSEIDVELGIFRTRIRKRRTIKMTLKLTDEGEEVVRGYYTITAHNAISSLVPPDKVDQGYVDIGACSA